MQPAHARLPDRVHARENLLRLGDRPVVETADQPVCVRPGLVIGFADDHAQPDAEAHLAAGLPCKLAHVVELGRDIGRRLALGQRFVDRRSKPDEFHDRTPSSQASQLHGWRMSAKSELTVSFKQPKPRE